MERERKVTADGYEANFATNTLGTFYLTTLMVPLLEKVQDPRVITVSSGGAYNERLDLSDLQSERGSYNGVTNYAQQKVVLDQLIS